MLAQRVSYLLESHCSTWTYWILLSPEGDRHGHENTDEGQTRRWRRKSECRLRKSEVERSWLQHQGRAAPGPMQTPARQRAQGGLAVSGGCMLFKNFLQQLYKRNPDSRLQRKHALWFCNITPDWQREILTQLGKEKLHVRSQLCGSWLICRGINTR